MPPKCKTPRSHEHFLEKNMPVLCDGHEVVVATTTLRETSKPHTLWQQPWSHRWPKFPLVGWLIEGCVYPQIHYYMNPLFLWASTINHQPSTAGASTDAFARRVGYSHSDSRGAALCRLWCESLGSLGWGMISIAIQWWMEGTIKGAFGVSIFPTKIPYETESRLELLRVSQLYR